MSEPRPNSPRLTPALLDDLIALNCRTDRRLNDEPKLTIGDAQTADGTMFYAVVRGPRPSCGHMYTDEVIVSQSEFADNPMIAFDQLVRDRIQVAIEMYRIRRRHPAWWCKLKRWLAR